MKNHWEKQQFVSIELDLRESVANSSLSSIETNLLSLYISEQFSLSFDVFYIFIVIIIKTWFWILIILQQLMMTWDYFSLYFHNCVEFSETRRLDVDQKYNDVKQDKKFVSDFATYFESLKTKMNITKSSKKNKLLYDLNDSIRKLIIFDVISSSIRQEILIKVVNVKRSSLYLSDRSTSIKNSFFEDRKRQKNKESIRNDSSMQLDKIKNDKIKKSDIDTSKRRSRACYNCEAMRHKQKDCFHSLKKTTTKINAIRKNKIKTFSRFIEVKSDSKNWEILSQ